MPQNIALTTEPLFPGQIISPMYNDMNGAVVCFIGTVRQFSNIGQKVTELEIKPLQDAENKLGEIASEITSKWPIKAEDIYIHRRYGRLKVGEIALVAAVGSVHRQEAFASCEYIIDRIKHSGITSEQ